MLSRVLTFVFLFFTLSLTVVQAGKFDTEACASDSECNSSCCGFNSGICAGPIIAQERDGGCGHGDAQPNDRAAQAFRAGMSLQQSAAMSGTTLAVVMSTASAPAVVSAATSATSVAAAAAAATGGFFITHACASDSECTSGCCGFKSGLCAGPIIAQSRDGGCGHGNAQPNDDAARALGFTGAVGT